MKNLLLLVTLALAIGLPVTRAFAGDISPNGISRPTLSTWPKKYLKNFPLNRITVDELIQYVGTPDKTYHLGDSDFVTADSIPKCTTVEGSLESRLRRAVG